MRRLLIFLVVVSFSSHSQAKECKVGKRCGNSCIAHYKTCSVNKLNVELNTKNSYQKSDNDSKKISNTENKTVTTDQKPLYKTYDSDQSSVDYSFKGRFIVVSAPVEVYEFANGGSEVMYSLNLGDEVTVTGRYRSWLEITKGNIVGFANAGQFKKLGR